MTEYAYGMWPAAVISVAIFIFFTLSYLKPKKRREWRSMGVFGAFTVALFTEMYGVPLTIYILTSVLGSRYPVLDPLTHINGHLWVAVAGGSILVWVVVMVVSNAAMLGGLIIMGKAWKLIHRARGEMVTSGLYSRLRHPQYAALLLITVGMLVQWPTILTAAMWPILIFMYYRLARREEREMEALFGDQYRTYRQQVPMIWPRLARASQTVNVEADWRTDK